MPTDYVPDAQVLDNQARAAKLGITIPGLKKPGIVSSADPAIAKNSQTAQHQAASSLLTSGQITPTPTYAYEAYKDSKSNTDMAFRSLQLTKDSELAANDLKYNELADDLQTNLNESLEIAAANAAALNPYAQAQGATTADNFQGAIKAKFADQARKLQRQADVARKEIIAGNYDGYVKLMQQAAKDTREFKESVYNWMVNEQKAQSDAAKAEYDKGQDAISNYVTLLQRDLPSVEALNQMSDEQLLQLPAVQAGIAAGYDINAAIQGVYDAATVQETSRTKDALEIDKIKLDMDNTRSIMADRNSDNSSRIPTFEEYLTAAENLAQMTFDEKTTKELRARYDMLFSKASMSNQDDELLSAEEIANAVKNARGGE